MSIHSVTRKAAHLSLSKEIFPNSMADDEEGGRDVLYSLARPRANGKWSGGVNETSDSPQN